MNCSIESILSGKWFTPEPARKAKAIPALETRRDIAKVPILSASMVAFINAKRSLIDGITLPDSELKAYGLLCEKFETGGVGPSKINKDDQGMPAMGSYQIRWEKLRDICYMLSIEGDYRLTSSNSSLFTNWIRKIGGDGRRSIW